MLGMRNAHIFAIHNDEINAHLRTFIFSDDAPARKRPIGNDANVSRKFVILGVETIINGSLLPQKLYFLIAMLKDEFLAGKFKLGNFH